MSIDLCVKLNDLDFNKIKCQCGCGKAKLDIRLFLFLKELEKRNIKHYVSSVFRCENHNKKVGGVPDSKHLFGLAVDVHFDNGFQDDNEFLCDMTELVADMGLRHINYPWGFHVDTGKRPGILYDIFSDLYENRLSK